MNLTKPLVRLGMLADLLRLLDTLPDSLKRFARIDIAQALVDDGQADEAMRLLQEAPDALERVYGNQNVAYRLIEAQRVDLARVLAKRAIHLARGISNQELRVETLASLLRSLQPAIDRTEVIQVSTEVRALLEFSTNQALRASSLINVAGALAKSGMDEDAMAMLRSAQRAAEQMNEGNPAAGMLTRIGEVLVDLRKPAEAAQLARQAWEMALRIGEVGARDPVFVGIARLFARLGDVDTAVVVAQRVEQTRIHALLNVMGELQTVDSRANALRMARITLEEAAQRQDANERASGLVAAVEVITKFGSLDEALQAVASAQSTAVAERERALLAIAIRLVQAGRPSDALRVVRQTTDRGRKGVALAEVGLEMARHSP